MKLKNLFIILVFFNLNAGFEVNINKDKNLYSVTLDKKISLEEFYTLLENIFKNTDIKIFSLTNSKINPIQLIYIIKALRNCKDLEYVDLSGNKMGLEAAIEIARLLKNKKIKYVDISNNNITEFGLKLISDNANSYVKIKADNNNTATDREQRVNDVFEYIKNRN